MSVEKPNLELLLERVHRGDRDAFAALYPATSRKLFGIVFRILHHQPQAEEVLQEVYILIWEHAHRFDATRATPITWMSTIARNRALDEVRKRRPEFVTDNLDEAVDPSAGPSAHLELSRELRKLETCLEQLGVDKSTAIKLAYLDGYSREQLAGRFAIPVGTIKTWLHRGLKQLKRCLDS